MTEALQEPMESLGSRVWHWYGADQYRLIILVGELLPALEFLALDAEGQRDNIGCCAECNLWSDYLEYLALFVKDFPPRLEPGLHQALQALLGACEQLSPGAYGTLDSNGFEHSDWAPLRQAANEAWIRMDCQTVRDDLPSLAEECRAALRKWPD